MSGSANFDDDMDIMEMDDLIEESLEDQVGDMLESNNEAMQIEHIEVKDPKMEEADKQIEKELENIPAKFDKTSEKKPAAKAAARPTTAKPKSAAPAKKPAPAAKKPSAPSEKDIANQKKAQARASSKAKTMKADAAPKPGPPKKKVDAEKLKQNIKKSMQKK